jgi:hypothetical protein
MTRSATVPITHVRGDATGLSIPAHGEALRADGADFLTEAFHAFGSLSQDNRVVRITQLVPCPGGSTGDKLFLSVEYARPDVNLHTDLFVKFSRDFIDSRRDHGRYEMEPEARFAPISRLSGFPISVPVAYFADYHHDSGTGLVITQRIAFGEGNIEPHHIKCLDHHLDNPLPYYRALITALARLAAAHKTGRLAPDIDERFPYDPATASSDPIRYSEEKLHAVLAQCAEFAARYPQLLPAEVREPAFIEKMQHDAFRIREPTLSTWQSRSHRAMSLERTYRQRLVLARCTRRLAVWIDRLGACQSNHHGFGAVGLLECGTPRHLATASR